jgi:hypothetical protein
VPTKLTKTEESLNQLCWDCGDQYGRVDFTYNYADATSINLYRKRDLFILQKTNICIAEMQDSEAVHMLFTHAAHMNTYEGQQSCLDLIGEAFRSAAEDIASVRKQFDDNYRDAWEARFGIVPFRSEEFERDTSIERTQSPRLG